ncbi:hypothetical protein [Streptomyces sp. NPDC053069]|uniref:hypothetical protein n=1 Tax=Streptomyces sp. NPDC053069 TaxID=3365695 RepID=UPI0037D278F9
MNEALDRVIEALAGVSEEEAAAALAAVGASVPRLSLPLASSGTPLPGPSSTRHIVSEVEWV